MGHTAWREHTASLDLAQHVEFKSQEVIGPRTGKKTAAIFRSNGLFDNVGITQDAVGR